MLNRRVEGQFMFVLLPENIVTQTSAVNHMLGLFCDIRFKRLQIKFISSPAKFIRRVIFQTDSAELSRTVISTQAKGIHIQLPQFGESVSIRIIGVAVAI